MRQGGLRGLGDIRLSELKISDVNDWMAGMSEEGYAPRTIAKPFRLLKQALNYAMANELITKNPCMFCKPPKRYKQKINALNREERSRMLDLARKTQPEPLGVAIELALTTEMRRGEVCGLRWSDLGDDQTITVRRAISSGEGGIYSKEPKTADSCRTIPLTDTTYERLCAMRSDFFRTMDEFSVRMYDPYLLGSKEPESKPYHPSLLTKEFTTFCKMNGFDCTFHDLQHTFATMLIGSGTDVRTVASYLGHASVSMTLNTYADVDPEAKIAAVSKIDAAFDEPTYLRYAKEPRKPQSKAIEEILVSLTPEQVEFLLASLQKLGV